MPIPTPTPEAFWQMFATLLKKHIEEQYGGHEDYWQMLSAVDSDIPIYKSEVTIQKVNPVTGKTYTVTHHVTVWDDMGHPISGIEDVGGRCKVDKKIVAKGYIFTCDECRGFYCAEHMKFFQGKDDKEVRLCHIGEKGGCFYPYEHKYLPTRIEERIAKLKLKVKLAQTKTELQQALAELDQAESQRKPGWLRAFFTSFFSFFFSFGGSAPLCSCGFNPAGGYAVTCPRCGRQLRLKPNEPKVCKYCFETITEIPCKCGKTIHV